MKMKQHIIGIFTTVCLTVSLFIFLDLPNLNEKIDIDFINMQKTIDYTVDKDSKCSLHSKEMSKAVVNIIYGLPTESSLEEIKMSQINFPNGWAYILGGCIFFDGKKEKAITYQCQSCVEAQEFWLKYYRWFTNLENLSEKGVEYEILEEIFNKINWNSSTTDKNDFIKKVFSRAYERFGVCSTEKQ